MLSAVVDDPQFHWHRKCVLAWFYATTRTCCRIEQVQIELRAYVDSNGCGLAWPGYQQCSVGRQPSATENHQRICSQVMFDRFISIPLTRILIIAQLFQSGSNGEKRPSWHGHLNFPFPT